jgi:hypothetical protein
MVLAEGCTSEYVIVIPDDASPSEVHAAEEFGHFVKEVSGADLPIRKEADGPTDHMVLIGRSKLTERYLLEGVDEGVVEGASLNPEGFVIRRAGPHLLIVGGRPRGTLYGVYDFLEDDLGCRWYTSKVSRIPKMDRIEIGDLLRWESPAFEYREPFYWDAFDGDWAARNKCNSANARLEDRHGGKVTYSHFVHTFSQIVGPDQFEAHPEYFALVNGKRQKGGSQLCLTNPDVLRIAKETVRKWIEEAPDAAIYSVSQNDFYGYCECDACKKVADEEGSQSGPILRLVNAIADDIAKDHPDKLIDTLAYWYSDVPPKITKPRPNVRIRMCPIGACEAHPYDQCEKDARFVEILKGWAKLTDNLYIWHYNTNFANYLMPFPDFVELISSIRLYKQNGVVGIFAEGNYSPGGGGSFDELKAYLLAKMFWDPDVDAWAVIDDFLAGYYGDAAPMMREYIDLLHAQLADGKNHFGIYTKPQDATYLSPEVMAKAEQLFDEMEKAVADDPDILRRVQKERLGIDYVKITRGDKTVDLDAFFAACRAQGIQRLNEWQPIDDTEKAIRK